MFSNELLSVNLFMLSHGSKVKNLPAMYVHEYVWIDGRQVCKIEPYFKDFRFYGLFYFL